ncbi:hypothetical protein GYH30_004225 [Glycine max]|nr:hypothetical protein JHK86_004349 [Glycine max]KAH1060659.1 hypothetical protein GYH30_004225 [Glycine max]KAH1060660.1 hypothetical protein GYH30_004225 [Glycine max]
MSYGAVVTHQSGSCTSLIQSNQRVALPSVDGRGRIMRSGEAVREMEMGSVVVEKVGGRSSVTSCFSRYPLKFIIPKKVGSSKTDAVWVYALNYGGGIVSGDNISCKFSVGDTCTMVLTTQGSTKKIGLLVRVAAETTESVYKFLRHQLAPLEPMIGVPPYR